MSPSPQGQGLVATAVGAAVDWLLEPAESPADQAATTPRPEPRRVVAVAGLARRCGTTVVARALGAELAARDVAGACAVTTTPGAAGVPFGLPAAGRLARVLGPLTGGNVRACGRLCLVSSQDRAAIAHAARDLAPLVLDVGDPAEASAAAALADCLLIVAAPATEPALARVVADSLAPVGPAPIVVLNRDGGDAAGHGWAEMEAVTLPESRMGAQLALAGREARGELGRAVSALAERCL